MDPDSVSLNESALSDGKKSSISDWRSKLASKFKNSGPGKDTYNVADASSYDSFSPSGNSSYRRMSDEAEPASHLGSGGVGAPKTEPPRRRTLNHSEPSASTANGGRKATGLNSHRGARAASVMGELRPVRMDLITL